MAKNNPHSESVLKSELMREFRKMLPTFVALRHEDLRMAGYPDISLTGLGKTSWIEIKHATPKFESTGIQELTMLRLARAGFARYVIYWEEEDQKRTLILHPRDLKEMSPEQECLGHQHDFIVEYFLWAHKQ